MATPEQIKIRISAQDDASRVLNNTRVNIDRVGASATNTAQRARTMTGALGGVGRSAGQAGIQFQQFVGQLQGGVSPFVAVSQQAADLGFVLGVPLVGAIVSIGAVIAGSLLPNLMESKKGFEDNLKEIKRLTDGFKGLTAAEQEYISFNLKAKIAERQQAIINLEAELQRLRRTTNDISQADIQIEGYLEDTDNATDTTRELNAQLSIEQRQLKELERQLKDIQEPMEGFAGSTEKVVNKFRELFTEVFDQSKFPTATDKTKVSVLELTESTDRWGKVTEDAARKITRVEKTALKGLEDGLVGLAMGTKTTAEAFRSMANSIISDLIRMQVRQSITAPLFNAIAGAAGTSFTTAPGYTSVGTGGGRSAATPSFAGGGYTGMGARSGGVDGKGGFPAILHPNETVVDHSQGQGGGVVINQTLNISTGVAQTVRTEIANLLPQITNATKAAVVDARRRGGSFAGAFGA